MNGLLLCGALSPLYGRSQGASASTSSRPVAIPLDPAWHLKGGLLSGRFLGPEAQADWPPWLQALILSRQDVPSQELGRADLYKVPDAFLGRAVQVLEAQRIFPHRLLRQVTAIGYTARAAEWQEAKSSYQIAYLKARGLPEEDPLTSSRLLTQLVYRNEFELLRQILQAAKLSPGIRTSFLRLVDLREGHRPPTEAWVLDRQYPAVERSTIFMALKAPSRPEKLLESFRGTDQLDLVVFHAISKGWIPLDSPLVSEAILLRKIADERTLWFLNRPEERVSDLLWMRAMANLRQGAIKQSVSAAKTILSQFPDSYYAGHAGFLVSGLEPASPPPAQPALRVPGDITVFNAKGIQAKLPPMVAAWPEKVQALVAKNRFDMVLAQADPEKEEALFLRAALSAGQQDLVARYQALEHRSSLATVPYLFPVHLEPLVARLLREEGLTGSVDTAFVLAMLKNESIFQPEARSGSEAFGIMQLLKPTFTRMVGKDADILDPETNIRAGLRYYQAVIKKAELENLPDGIRMLYILAGYHAGEGRARRWRFASDTGVKGKSAPVELMLRIDDVPISSTRNYILRVLGDRELFRFYLKGNGQ